MAYPDDLRYSKEHEWVRADGTDATVGITSYAANELGDIVRAKAEEGLTVRGVMDEEQVNSNQGTEFDPFRQADIDVLIDGIEAAVERRLHVDRHHLATHRRDFLVEIPPGLHVVL